MNRLHAPHPAGFDLRRANDVDKAHDESAPIKQDRELRALACRLAACAYWQVAEYRVLSNVKSEGRQPTP
jgi:hypothetical protein